MPTLLPCDSELPASSSVADPAGVPLAWYSDYPNWGDTLNPVLVGLLSGRPVHKVEVGSGDCFIAVGSILWMADSRTEVWGTGFMKEDNVVAAPPKIIHAVRGPLTRALLLKAGIDCPEVYGDPALLLPMFFDPVVPKQYDVGVIPHISDKDNPWIARLRDQPGILTIDVQSEIWEFIRAVKSCRVIFSSSLHGLICADAYGVPNAWIRLSERVPGGHFKFRDYALSIGANEPQPVYLRPETSVTEVAAQAQLHPLKIDLPALVLSCPFLSEELRQKFARQTG